VGVEVVVVVAVVSSVLVVLCVFIVAEDVIGVEVVVSVTTGAVV
jgi:hypothetical protein